MKRRLGAALADDLRAPEVSGDGPSGWVTLAGYAQAQPLPDGVNAMSNYVSVPEVLVRAGWARSGWSMPRMARGCRPR